MIIFGFDPIKTIKALRNAPLYLRDYWLFKKQLTESNTEITLMNLYPCLEDRFVESGNASGHYFHQDLLVARRIYHHNPKLHVDIGSRIDGFVAHVASFRKIEIFDVRPQNNRIKNMKFIKADLMKDIDKKLIDYCDSLSCLHALEHFGLGRYGDAICIDGHLKGLNNLYKILKNNGKLYLSIPIGSSRVEFNAHRVFCLKYLLDLFNGKYNIDRFSYVNDKGDLYKDVELNKRNIENNFHCRYGCGIFEMTKI